MGYLYLFYPVSYRHSSVCVSVRACVRGWSKTHRVRLAVLRWVICTTASDQLVMTCLQCQPIHQWPTHDDTVHAAPTAFTLMVTHRISLLICCCSVLAFSALTLLAGHQEERPACKNWMMRCWWLQRGADCLHMVQLMPLHPKTHHLLPHLNPDWFDLSGTGFPRLSCKRGC